MSLWLMQTRFVLKLQLSVAIFIHWIPNFFSVPSHFNSIKLRTTILQRGLADRSTAVTKECLKLMKDEWLVKSCNGDPIKLLKYLDVETYELVGESVMWALLKAGLVKVLDGQSINQFLVSTTDTTEGRFCL